MIIAQPQGGWHRLLTNNFRDTSHFGGVHRAYNRKFAALLDAPCTTSMFVFRPNP